MKKYVIDCCVLARFGIDYKYDDSDKIRRLIKQAIKNKVELIAPELLFFEINNVLVKSGLTKEQYNKSINEIMMLISSGIIKIVNTDEALLVSARNMAEIDTKGQGYVSSYDATYHCLALRENAEFLTTDKKHTDKVQKIYGSFILYKDLDI